MATFKSFEELDCWKRCREVRNFIKNLTKNFPAHEKYDLTSNIKRAARSATRNIAEGFGRHHHKENLQFCRISRGSLFEILDDLEIALEEGYINQERYAEGRKLVKRAINVLNGYIRYLKNKI